MNKSPPRIRLPRRRTNARGEPRRVGVELEMIGLELNDIAEIVARHLGLSISTDGRYRRVLSGDPAGDWAVELDFEFLRRLGERERAAARSRSPNRRRNSKSSSTAQSPAGSPLSTRR